MPQGSGDGSVANEARLGHIVAPVGCLVSAGDVVAILQNGEATTQVRSPNNGKVQSFSLHVDDKIKAGQTLFALDTDVEIHTDVPDVMQHLAVNNGELDSKFLQTYLSLEEPDRIWSLAVLLVERFPSLSIQALQLLERLQILQTEAAPVEDRIQTLVYTSRLLWRMGDLDQARVQAEIAVSLDANNLVAQKHLSEILLQAGEKITLSSEML